MLIILHFPASAVPAHREGKGWDRQSLKLHNNEKVTPAAASLQGLHQAEHFWCLILVRETVMRSEISTEGRAGMGNKISKMCCSPETFQSFDGQGRESASQPRNRANSTGCVQKYQFSSVRKRKGNRAQGWFNCSNLQAGLSGHKALKYSWDRGADCGEIRKQLPRAPLQGEVRLVGCGCSFNQEL